MDQELVGALIVFIVLMIGIFGGAWLFVRNRIEEKDSESNLLRTIFCLEHKRKAITRIQIARSPTEEDIEFGRKNTFFGNFETLKISFKQDGVLSSPISPGIKSAFKKSLRRLASSPGHHQPPFTPPVISPTNSMPLNPLTAAKKAVCFSTSSLSKTTIERRNSF